MVPENMLPQPGVLGRALEEGAQLALEVVHKEGLKSSVIHNKENFCRCLSGRLQSRGS